MHSFDSSTHFVGVQVRNVAHLWFELGFGYTVTTSGIYVVFWGSWWRINISNLFPAFDPVYCPLTYALLLKIFGFFKPSYVND